MKRFENKVVVITGASSGLGRAAAERIGSEGANLLLVDIDATALTAAKEAIEAAGDGGKVVTNPSGGLLSKGHPLGATGLAQCYELTQQVRGTADKRQVENVKLALQHNLGLGGACVVTVYGRA